MLQWSHLQNFISSNQVFVIDEEEYQDLVCMYDLRRCVIFSYSKYIQIRCVKWCNSMNKKAFGSYWCHQKLAIVYLLNFVLLSSASVNKSNITVIPGLNYILLHSGELAQMVERLLSMQEVLGSIPRFSKCFVNNNNAFKDHPLFSAIYTRGRWYIQFF